jgi:hypothetical protein
MANARKTDITPTMTPDVAQTKIELDLTTSVSNGKQIPQMKSPTTATPIKYTIGVSEDHEKPSLKYAYNSHISTARLPYMRLDFRRCCRVFMKHNAKFSGPGTEQVFVPYNERSEWGTKTRAV